MLFGKKPIPDISVIEFRGMLSNVCEDYNIKMAAYKVFSDDNIIHEDTVVEVYLMYLNETGNIDLAYFARDLRRLMKKKEVNYFVVDSSMPYDEFKEKCGTICYRRQSQSKHYRRPREGWKMS